MRSLLFLFLFVSLQVFAQIDMKPKTPLVKDPFFNQNQVAGKAPQQAEKVKLIHSDLFQKKQDMYEGNPFFSGNVRLDHKGSILTADEVILYEEQNFVKAKGNVRLQNADGSTITAEEMEYDGNTQKGIARKNVVLTDPTQTIKTETLYYDRVSNQAYFNTGGTIYANNSVTYAKNATYNVSTKIIDLTSNIKIDNDQYTLEGQNISQDQNTNTATFTGPTTITNKKNPSNYVFTENGRYLQNTQEFYLNKNSRIHYNGKILKGDQMYYNKVTGFGKAEGNVHLNDPRENRFIRGGYGEIYEKIDSAMITNQPYAVKVLKNDSMFFSAERILAYQKIDSTNAKKSFLRAYKKSRFFKSNAQARADSLSFNETDGIMKLRGAPILWSGQKQVTGDSIDAFFDTKNEYIDSLNVVGNALAISKADSLNMKDEFHQVKGRKMSVFYKENEITLAKVIGNAQAITYADSQDEKTKEVDRIGLSLSTCGTIDAEFIERKIYILSCNIGAQNETYPMSMVDKEKRFFPDFNWNTKDRPKVWKDILVDSPNYPETVYTSDDSLYQKAQEEVEKKRQEEAKKLPQRVKK